MKLSERRLGVQIPAYFVMGTPTSGRRGVVWDAVARGSMEGEFSVVFVSSNEEPSDFDAAIAGSDNAGIVKYSGAADAAAKLGALDPEKISRVFYLADSSKNPADEIEAFKALVSGGKIRLARIWSVVDCSMAEKFPKETSKYIDMLSHFADCVLLSRRSGASAKSVGELRAQWEKMRRPHVVEYADKNFRTKNPIELLIDEARRISMFFDEFDPVDELELDAENLPEEPFSLERKPDPYLARLPGGMRADPVENPAQYALKARIMENEK